MKKNFKDIRESMLKLEESITYNLNVMIEAEKSIVETFEFLAAQDDYYGQKLAKLKFL